MVKIFSPLLFGLMCVVFSVEASPDSAATITSSKEKFEFVYNAKLNRVEVAHLIHNVYNSNAYDVNIPIVENYNDEVTIDEVSCKVDDRNVRDFKTRIFLLPGAGCFLHRCPYMLFPHAAG